MRLADQLDIHRYLYIILVLEIVGLTDFTVRSLVQPETDDNYALTSVSHALYKKKIALSRESIY